ncbi:MAG: hypothetical protein HY826_05540 [Actinobacteria bacterium]|nr:hypothetical protein [Actinomycetota bacterium]
MENTLTALTSTPTSLRMERMALTIDRRGINAIPVAALRELGFQAVSAGSSRIVAEVLADPCAPPVARERAFGIVATVLAGPRDRAPKAAPCSPQAA